MHEDCTESLFTPARWSSTPWTSIRFFTGLGNIWGSRTINFVHSSLRICRMSHRRLGSSSEDILISYCHECQVFLKACLAAECSAVTAADYVSEGSSIALEAVEGFALMERAVVDVFSRCLVAELGHVGKGQHHNIILLLPFIVLWFVLIVVMIVARWLLSWVVILMVLSFFIFFPILRSWLFFLFFFPHIQPMIFLHIAVSIAKRHFLANFLTTLCVGIFSSIFLPVSRQFLFDPLYYLGLVTWLDAHFRHLLLAQIYDIETNLRYKSSNSVIPLLRKIGS